MRLQGVDHRLGDRSTRPASACGGWPGRWPARPSARRGRASARRAGRPAHRVRRRRGPGRARPGPRRRSRMRWAARCPWAPDRRRTTRSSRRRRPSCRSVRGAYLPWSRTCSRRHGTARSTARRTSPPDLGALLDQRRPCERERPIGSVRRMPGQPYLEAVRERIVVFDGAFGTFVQGLDLSADDFGGTSLEGCNEMLCLTRPDVIRSMHDAFLDVGVDVLETASFGSFSVVLNEYAIPEQTHALNVAAARLAREVADDHATDGRPRYVAGSIGPGTKLPSLGHITFDDLRDAYEEQAAGLLEGGVDLFLIETCIDLLQVEGGDAGLPAGDARCRPRGAAAGAGVDGDHRADARRQRDRRGAHQRAGDAPRRARDQLRHRPGRDAGAPPLPQPALAAADQRAAERRPAVDRRRQDALRPHPAAARRVPPPPRQRAGHRHRRRVLRHDARAPPPGGRGGARPGAGARAPRVRAERQLDLQPGHDGPGAERAAHRRAHQRQRLQGVPRVDARRRLGRLHEDGQRADPRGRPRARRVRRLRRTRRRRRHGRDRQALRHPGQRAARARQHRAAGARGRPAPHRRPGDPQLGQPRGRRAARQPHGPCLLAGPRLRRRGRSAC